MKGPAEMIRDDLSNLLPDYMVPNRVIVLDKLPLTANGKIDTKALGAVDVESAERPFVGAADEDRGADPRALEEGDEAGGCLGAGRLLRVRRQLAHRGRTRSTGSTSAFQCSLPLQVLFEAPTVEKLALRLGRERHPALVTAGPAGSARGAKPPVYCWPGLGGYTMNLRLLASKLGIGRPFHGVQAHGINTGRDSVPHHPGDGGGGRQAHPGAPAGGPLHALGIFLRRAGGLRDGLSARAVRRAGGALVPDRSGLAEGPCQRGVRSTSASPPSAIRPM